MTPKGERFELAEAPLLDLYDEAMSEESELDALELLGDGTARYAIIQEIGQGSWKTILLAHDLSTGRDVAMAIPRQTASEEKIARFIHEARILARLEHAAILRLYDLGLDKNEKPFFVTKYVSGTTLQEKVDAWNRGKLKALSQWPLNRRMELFAQLCSGVAYAHNRGVIHRDLKPDNILLDDYDQVLICDWGLARLIEGDDAHAPLLMDNALSTSEMRAATLDGVVKGTPGYMAPEQASGKVDDLGPATDVYALGAILYALVAYRPPVSGGSTKSIIQRTIAGSIAPPAQTRPDLNIPAGLEAIAMKALATKPENRYKSVSLMLDDLHAFTTGFAPAAQNAGMSAKATLFVRRNKRILTVGFAALLAIAGLAAFQIHQHRKTQKDQAQFSQKEEELSSTLAAAQIEAQKAQTAAVEAQKFGKFISEQAATVIVDQAVTAYKAGDFPTAFQQLEVAMTTSVQNERMWRLDNLLHMARFEIDEAIEAANHPTDPRYLAQTQLPLLFSQRKDPKHFPELIQHLQQNNGAFLLPAACVLFPPTRPEGAERNNLRLTLLKMLNPRQTTWSVSFKKQKDGWAIDLANHKNVTDVTPVLGEDVVEIDLRNTATTFSTYLHNAKHVKRFILTKEQVKTAKLGSRAIIK